MFFRARVVERNFSYVFFAVVQTSSTDQGVGRFEKTVDVRIDVKQIFENQQFIVDLSVQFNQSGIRTTTAIDRE